MYLARATGFMLRADWPSSSSSSQSLFHRVQLDPLERAWWRSSAVGNMAAQRQLLAQDSSLVLKKVQLPFPGSKHVIVTSWMAWWEIIQVCSVQAVKNIQGHEEESAVAERLRFYKILISTLHHKVAAGKRRLRWKRRWGRGESLKMFLFVFLFLPSSGFRHCKFNTVLFSS